MLKHKNLEAESPTAMLESGAAARNPKQQSRRVCESAPRRPHSPATRALRPPVAADRTSTTRIALIGCGHWGPNHIRNFSSLPHVEVVAACDLDQDRLATVGRTYPFVRMVADAEQLIEDPNIDAVVIATPAGSHFELARKALAAGKDVLCEKPLALRSEHCRELVHMADAAGRILMVGHVFLFNPGIRKLHELIHDGKVGRVYYAHAAHTNLGPIRPDINAAWDLASHDVSTLNYLFGGLPLEVSAVGGRFLQQSIEDVVFLSLVYPRGIVANVHVSWMNPKRVRELTVVGDKTMVVWSDLDPDGSIRIYDKGVVREPYYDTFGDFQLSLREGDVSIPRVRMSEPLRIEAEHFVECIRYRKRPMSDGAAALDVVRTLEAVDASLACRGAAVRVERE